MLIKQTVEISLAVVDVLVSQHKTEMSWLSPAAADRPETSSSIVDRTAVEHHETDADREDKEDEEQQPDFSDEYKTWKSRTLEILESMDLLRRSLDDRVAGIRDRSVQELCENCDEVEATRNELEKLGKMFHGTEKFVVEDLSGSLEALRHSLASFSQTTRDKLNDERHQLAEPGSPSVTFHLPSSKYDSNYCQGSSRYHFRLATMQPVHRLIHKVSSS